MTGTVGNTSDRRISVLCVDDNRELVAVLRSLIDLEPDMLALEGMHEAGSFIEAAASLRPNVAIVDLTMPGTVSPLEAIRRAAELAPDTRVIAYSGYDDRTTRDLVVEAGAWGFVSKHDDFRRIIEAVRIVAAGGIAW